MTDKQLIKNLNSLKSVSPDSQWLKENRELLLTQISNSGAVDISPRSSFVINLHSFMKTATQPAFAMAVFVCLLVTGSLFSHQLFNKTQPNDSLYIARIISEKAKLNTIFNQAERDKMAMQFASNHAQEITNILADPEFNHNDEVTVAKLSENFKKEIDVVKTKIGNLSAVSTDDSKDVSSNDGEVVMANSSKNEQGLEYVDPVVDSEEAVDTVVTEKVDVKDEQDTASSTPEEVDVKAKEEVLAPDQILEEVQESFDHQDYGNTLDKLKEVDNIIK